MNRDFRNPVTGDALLDTFAAELADTAYHAALRTSRPGTWLDLELELWRALADTLKTREVELAACHPSGGLLVPCGEGRPHEVGPATAT